MAQARKKFSRRRQEELALGPELAVQRERQNEPAVAQDSAAERRKSRRRIEGALGLDSAATGFQPSEPRVTELTTQNPRKANPYPLLSRWENHKELQDLRLQLGTPESRRRIRYGFRASSEIWELSRPCYLESCKAKASQAPHVVPITVRPALKRGSVRRPPSVVPPSQNENLVEKLSGLQLSIQFPSRPGLMDLALETREQIYGYLLPVYVLDKFQAKDCDIYEPDPVTIQSECRYVQITSPVHYEIRHGGLDSTLYRNRGGKNSTAVLRVNKQIHREAEAYLFRGSTVRMKVNETGCSLFEYDTGGLVKCGCNEEWVEGYDFHYRCGDRFTQWHQIFVAGFDFSLPKKLIISIEAPDYENPEGVLQIAQSMMGLCDQLRKSNTIKEIEIEPQSLEYRLIAEDRTFRYDHLTSGSYFVWQWENGRLPASQPSWHHKCTGPRWRFAGVPFWVGAFSFTLLPKTPDLQIVTKPLRTLGNVLKASIKHPPTSIRHEMSVKRWFMQLCAPIEGRGSFNAENQIAKYHVMVRDCQQQLKDPRTRQKVKKANRTRAKDLWYSWHCETCGEEFTDHGEQGYESDGDPDW